MHIIDILFPSICGLLCVTGVTRISIPSRHRIHYRLNECTFPWVGFCPVAIIAWHKLFGNTISRILNFH